MTRGQCTTWCTAQGGGGFAVRVRCLDCRVRRPEVPDSGPTTVGLFGKGSRLSQKRRKFTPEYREEAVKMVIETSRPVAQVARELGLVEGTL
ncbi:transposase, partial [Streptomyces sp. NPDC057910]|uniref:transposase n=1 Tax=Streptomyces sp. NPDC057910 TaxID=3346278 RepID=UPI0036EBB908